MRTLTDLRARGRDFFKKTGGNIAISLALAAVPLTLAMGAGVDYARGLAVHSNMADALDSAALAVGAATSKPDTCSSSDPSTAASCSPLQTIAQQYFSANFKPDSGSDQVGTVSISIANQAVTLSVSDQVPTTFLKVADRLLSSSALESMNVTASSTVVWGQTKLWVALVLDNSGSMANNSKLTTLQSAATTLLTTLQGASQTAGDVEAAIIPFDAVVKAGTSNVGASWLDWTDWEAAPAPGGTTITDTYAVSNYIDNSPSTIAFSAWGPGDSCPFTSFTTNWRGTISISTLSPFGYYCTSGSANNSSNTNLIPSSGTYKGYICPSDNNAGYNNDHLGRYFNGCWTSTKSVGNTVRVSSGSGASCTDSDGNGFSASNCSCTGSNGSKHCDTQKWTHAWVLNNHSSWGGCIMDRTQNYDIQNTAPSGTSNFPATNPDTCTGSAVTPLSYNWSNLTTQINAMVANGSTNQAIGIAHGWQMLTPGSPYSTPSIPTNTSRFIILLSDGLNTQDRWWGDGSTEGSSDDGNIDGRENSTCTAAKTDGITVYSLYVNINNSDGDSAPLSNCASDSSKYFVISSASQIATDFSFIAQQITNLRVSR